MHLLTFLSSHLDFGMTKKNLQLKKDEALLQVRQRDPNGIHHIEE